MNVSKLFFLFLFFLAVNQITAQTISLYETFEKDISLSQVKENKFQEFIDVEFTDGKRVFNVHAFHYGGNIWKIRFMPDKAGDWKYKWKYNNLIGSGEFSVLPDAINPKANGHVHRKGKYLICDNGSYHYWYGGKWIGAQSYSPKSKNGIVNKYSLSNDILISYFDSIAKYKHNGVLLKVNYFPLEDDGVTWDTIWINRADWIVKELGKRGLYCQINIFDTWARGRDSVFHFNTFGENQVLNAWKDDELTKKEAFIKYIISRFSSYYNVYWELGNEMDHKPNNGDDFAVLANKYYIPWIRKYDPYNLPIGLSEGIWKKTNVDLGFCHNPVDFPSNKDTIPVIYNEQVFWELEGYEDVGPALWRDETIRNSKYRYVYRRNFWKIYTLGGSGATSCSNMVLLTPVNDAVINVMKDQMRLRDFMEAQPKSFEMLHPDASLKIDCNLNYQSLSDGNGYYITYLYGNVHETPTDSNLSIDVPAGRYSIQWFHPSTAKYGKKKKMSSKKLRSIEIPKYNFDIVFILEKL